MTYKVHVAMNPENISNWHVLDNFLDESLAERAARAFVDANPGADFVIEPEDRDEIRI
jgi:hypothetical protein